MKIISSLVPIFLVLGIGLIALRMFSDFLNKDEKKGSSIHDIDDVFPYFKVNLLSEAELKCYKNLVKAFPEFSVFAQVQLSQIVGIPKNDRFMYWLNRINRMSLDFVISDSKASVLCVIELDDPTHGRKDRVVADLKKDKVLESAGIPLHRFRVENLPTIPEMKKALALT